MLPGITPALFDGGPRKTVLLSTVGAGSWTVPDDWNVDDNSVECIGGGAGGLGGVNGQSGGGGGAYAKSINLPLIAGASIPVQIGAGGVGSTTTTGNAGGDTWFGSAAFPAAGDACGARGAPAAVRNAVSPGGAAASSYASGTGSLKSSGGAGGAGVDTTNNCGGGGGGAGGPNGSGASGATAGSPGGGGGGNGGGANGTVPNGGNNSLGTGGAIDAGGTPARAGTLGGGGAGGDNPPSIAVGGVGGDGIDIIGTLGGGGGGGGGYVSSAVSNATQGGSGGLYGGGGGGAGQRLSATGTGGAGRQGAAIIRYRPAVSPYPKLVGVATTTDNTASTTHNVNLPAGNVGDMLIVFIGGGGITAANGGWTSLDTLSAVYRIATGADALSVTLSGSFTLTAVAYRIKGYAGVPEAVSVTAASVTTIDPPALTPSWGLANNLWFATCIYSYPSAITLTATPANYRDAIFVAPVIGANNSAVYTSTRLLRATSDDPGVFNLSAATQPRGRTVAIRGA